MRTAYLTRAVHFSASHRYHRPEWSEEENRRKFGPSARPGGHGHDYRCEVTVCGPVDVDTGMVISLDVLDDVLREEVVDRMHNRHLNDALEEFGPGRAIPTTENLADHIFERVQARLPSDIRVHRVRVLEDPNLWSDVYGDGRA